jgi:hypothetical protein
VKRSTKAVIFSCLVFPGAGHLYLKRFMPGLLLTFGAAAAVYFIVSSAVHTALEVAEEIQGGGVPLDMETITGLVSQRTRSAEDSANSPLIVLFALWLIGILDSYRVGHALEKSLGQVSEKGTNKSFENRRHHSSAATQGRRHGFHRELKTAEFTRSARLRGEQIRCLSCF